MVSAPPEDADVETASAGYASRFDSSVGRWMLRRQLEITMELLRDKGRSTILDVGGGHGQVAPDLARLGHHVTVLASSTRAVSAALRPAITEGSVHLVVGDFREPPVEPRSFDIVISYRLLAHAHDLHGLVAGIARSADRTVLVDYATSSSFNAVADTFFSAKKKVERNTRPFHVLRDNEVNHLFRENGCRLAARRPQFFWPMALHRALRAAWIARGLETLPALVGARALFGSPVIARFDRV